MNDMYSLINRYDVPILEVRNKASMQNMYNKLLLLTIMMQLSSQKSKKTHVV